MNNILRINRLLMHALSSLVILSFLGNTAKAQTDSVKDVVGSTNSSVIKKQQVKQDAYINALPVAAHPRTATTSLTELKSSLNRQSTSNAVYKNNTSKLIINLVGISALYFVAQKTNRQYLPNNQH